MFPQNQGGPQTGNGFPTSAALQQNVSLLGNSPTQAASNFGGMPSFDPSILNTTAPGSSTLNPGVASMVKALKGPAQ